MKQKTKRRSNEMERQEKQIVFIVTFSTGLGRVFANRKLVTKYIKQNWETKPKGLHVYERTVQVKV